MSNYRIRGAAEGLLAVIATITARDVVRHETPLGNTLLAAIRAGVNVAVELRDILAIKNTRSTLRGREDTKKFLRDEALLLLGETINIMDNA